MALDSKAMYWYVRYIFIIRNVIRIKKIMGRPKVDDKLKQVPVPVRQSLIDKLGKETIIKDLKQYLNKHYAPQSEHMPG